MSDISRDLSIRVKQKTTISVPVNFGPAVQTITERIGALELEVKFLIEGLKINEATKFELYNEVLGLREDIKHGYKVAVGKGGATKTSWKGLEEVEAKTDEIADEVLELGEMIKALQGGLEKLEVMIKDLNAAVIEGKEKR